MGRQVILLCDVHFESNMQERLLTRLFAAPIPKAANWAVGTFVFLSFATHEFCQYRRFIEKSHMKRAVEIIDRKKVNKEVEAQRKREERRRLKEAADKAAEEASRKSSSWKFW
jgi:cytochrome c oxidase assembly protein subunit 20